MHAFVRRERRERLEAEGRVDMHGGGRPCRAGADDEP